jgi:hypothetical protein
MISTVQSWYDVITQSTMDPRNLISNPNFQDQAGAGQFGSFLRSTNWLQAVTWVAPVIKVSPSVAAPASIMATNPQDFASIEAAQTWNATHAMTSINPQLPLVSEGTVFVKSGTNFVNLIPLDFIGAATSTSVQLSFRDNSLVAGDFTAGASGTIPVFDFGSATFGGTSHVLQMTLLQTGHFQMGIRVIDNGGNFSMFPLDLIVL